MSYNDVVGIPDSFSAYASFQYRLWFTWRGLPPDKLRQPHIYPDLWPETLSACPWLWDDESGDEECIKAFAEDSSLLPQMLLVDWANACRALQAHQSSTRTTLPHPLHPLTSEIRLYFIAWLMVTAPPQSRGDFEPVRKIEKFISDWAELIAMPDSPQCCDFCEISHILPLWIGTMRQVYELDHLRSIPRNHECSCWESSLTVAGEPFRRTPVSLHADSPVLLVLYELVVPLWPLVCWVAFRAIVKDGTVQAFLDLLRTPDRDLLDWEDEDQNELFDRDPYQRWAQYIAEIDLQTWLQIRRTTRTAKIRPWRYYYKKGMDWRMRLIALIRKYISTFDDFKNVRENVWNILDIGLSEQHVEDLIAAVTDDGEQSTPDNFECQEFWSLQNLQHWLTRDQKITFKSGQNIPHTTVLMRVQYMDTALLWGWWRLRSFKNLGEYTYFRMLQNSGGGCSTETLIDKFDTNWWQREDEGVTKDSFKLDFLFDFLKCLVKGHSATRHAISTDIYESINRDIPSVVVKVVCALKETASLEKIMASRGSEAQELLNLLQELLDLDSFHVIKPSICKALMRLSQLSGLHPRCFPITGLQKIGQQVAGGGFGDIWKGLVSGQTVSVKIMRVFQEEDVAAVLKQFGREALIWRQLCHPNLLPFFGLYYIENRLCLVSPWMENGNVMQYLQKQSSNLVHSLSLMLDVAFGMKYLHEQKVVHGDLKAINILVTPSGRACICDFGLSSIVNEISLRLPSTSAAKGATTRYCAPELLKETSKKHFASDIYAFGCVCYEILTGNVPFYGSSDAALVVKVLQGEHPPRLSSCCGTAELDTLWDLLEICWAESHEMRPTAAQIVERLVNPSIGATTTSSTTDWDQDFTCRFRRSLQNRPLLPSVNQIERVIFGDEVAQACIGCFPSRESSKSQEKQDTANLKRRYEDREGTSDSEEHA